MTLYRRDVLGIAAVAGVGLIGGLGPARAGSIHLAGGCNSDNTPFLGGEYQTSPPRDDLLALFRRVLHAATLSPTGVAVLETENPQIKAYAQYLDEKRTVVVNSQLVSEHLEGRDSPRLAALLAHEVAHFSLNHVFGDDLRDKWSEAAADRVAGITCARMDVSMDAAEVFAGMAHGGRYATPKRRMDFFLLGGVDEVTAGLAEAKAYIVNEIQTIRTRLYQAPGTSKRHIKLYSPGAHDELIQLGSLGELFVTNAEGCAHSTSSNFTMTVDFAVGFSKSDQTKYRVLTLQWRYDSDANRQFSPEDVLQLELQPRSYSDPDELFFNEAFDSALVRSGALSQCGPNKRPLR